MNSRDLFYVRYLQLATSKVYKAKLYALFIFERELFKFYPRTEEKILSKIKLKWLFEEIEQRNRNNIIIKNFNDIDFVYKYMKKLLVIYESVIDKELEHNIIPVMKEFSKEFNEFSEKLSSNIDTSYIFQIVYMIYDNNLKISNQLHDILNSCYNRDYKSMKRVESVFVSLFLKTYLKKKKNY